ncbi:MAG: DUF1810 domain-containing protein [Bacteroides sp.]|nr:DUF1810 domain-containing protein [Bacteroides sp.]MCM1413956.1 DUF1810 domain-containing protein [Bacteroides sp.]MCM1471827.1 DUF1810 domain-containing protein [Bacteroides sp.]
MEDAYNLQRFVDAQSRSYESALSELRAGRKTSHWMWYIFPQLKHLGRSNMSKFYGLTGADEAAVYLRHPLLNERLRAVCSALLALDTNDARTVMGGIDSHKLKSSMTLFDAVAPNDIFSQVLDKFYMGRRDPRTLGIISCR